CGPGGQGAAGLGVAWIDALRGELAAVSGILDLGTGSGVLALAALALGGPRAIGCDVDPLAVAAAGANARANGLADRLEVFTGGVEALSPAACFAGIAANLLPRELDPVFERLAPHLKPQGWLAISGLLGAEREHWTARGERAGLRLAGTRSEADASGAVWVSLLMRPARARAAD